MNYQNIYVILESIEDTPPVYSGCGMVHGTSVHSRDAVVVKDLRISGKGGVLAPKREMRYIEDGGIRVKEIPWIKCRFMDQFAEQAYRLTSITRNPEAGWFQGFHDEKVYRGDKSKLEEMATKSLILFRRRSR